MNRKLKALGALLSAALMVGAIAVVSAPAETGGHFVSAEAHTILKGGQDPTGTALELHDALGSIHCGTQTFSGTTIAGTTESVTINPTYGNCTVTGSTNTVHVAMNGCTYTFKVLKVGANANDNTVELVCPAGKSVTLSATLEHSATVACIEHIPPQKLAGGAVYTNVVVNGVHTVTVDATAKGITVTRTAQFFGGCKFAAEHGTTGELTGNGYIEGTNTEGTKAVSVTAT